MNSNQLTSILLSEGLSIGLDSHLFKQNDSFLFNEVLRPEVMIFLKKSMNKKFTLTSLLNGTSSEYRLDDKATKFKLNLMFNHHDILNDFSRILGTPIKSTNQRLYYVDKSCHHLDWHDDSHEENHRIAALRIELSDNEYNGGDLLIKDMATHTMTRYSNIKLGQGVLFKISYGKIYHKVEPIIGAGKRMSFIIFFNA